jgi:hypothetical protein
VSLYYAKGNDLAVYQHLSSNILLNILTLLYFGRYGAIGTLRAYAKRALVKYHHLLSIEFSPTAQVTKDWISSDTITR